MLERSHLLSASSMFPERDASARAPVLRPLCHFTHCSPQRSLSQSASWCPEAGPALHSSQPLWLAFSSQPASHRKLAFVMFPQSPAQPSHVGSLSWPQNDINHSRFCSAFLCGPYLSFCHVVWFMSVSSLFSSLRNCIFTFPHLECRGQCPAHNDATWLFMEWMWY